MTAITGRSGVVKISSNAVAEVVSFSFEESADMVETTELIDTAKTYDTDIVGWTASIEAHLDNSDSNGQGAMTIGAEVELHMLQEGTTTGDIDSNGQAHITGISKSNAGGSTAAVSFTVQGNGPLSHDALV